MSSASAYQPELDGLRALAVTAVLLTHLDVSWLPGGFIGVDVFFVLSGYLITRLIQAEIDRTGELDFRAFYVRRIRRLVPALISTIALTCVGAFLLLSPTLFSTFAASVPAAIFSFSNIHFYLEADYFDALATSKPLLHTWSLSIEEQFYLVWPVLMLLGSRWLRPRWQLLAVLGVCAVSLAVAQYLLAVDTTAAFYMLPSRAFELGIGAALVWLPALTNKLALNLLAAVGLAAMIVPMFLYTPETPFPGVAALLPCAGAAAFIAASRAPIARALGLAPFAFIGRISYSLYLVHWPLIVLWRAYFYQPLSLTDQIVLAVAAVLLAWLQYRFIEQPLRRPVPGRNWRVLGALAVFAITISGTSVSAAGGDGWSWRVPKERLTSTASPLQSRNLCGRFHPDLDRKLVTCQNYREKARDIFVWGDSHALHLAPGLSAAYPDHNIYVLYSSGCVPQSGFGGYLRVYSTEKATQECVERNLAALKFFRASPPKNIIITSSKRASPEEMASVTQPIIQALEHTGSIVTFLGDFIQPGVDLVDCTAVPTYLLSNGHIVSRCRADTRTSKRELAYNNKLTQLLPDYVSINQIHCPNDTCQYYDDRGQLLYRDYHHLSATGSRLLVGRAKALMPY